MNRERRDIEAEAMRRERIGMVRPLWSEINEEAKEEWRRRADTLARIRAEIEQGVGSILPGQSDIITSVQLVTDPAKERIVRVLPDLRLQVALLHRTTGAETPELTVDLREQLITCGRILASDKQAIVPGLYTTLAATIIAQHQCAWVAS